MKHLLTKGMTLSLLLLCMCANRALAYDFQVDGIYYTITDRASGYASVVSGEVKYSGDVTIPETITYDGVTYIVTGMGKSAFYGCTELSSVTINDRIHAISESAFSGCSYLSKVSLGANVESIGYAAFYNCAKLAEINLGDKITAYKEKSFFGCASLTSVVISENVLTLEHQAFAQCSNIKTLEIRNGVTEIGTYAFAECPKLQTVDIPHSVLTIGRNAFYGCSSLTTIKIGDGVERLNESTFGECPRLKYVTVGSGCRQFDYGVFGTSKQLESVTLLSPQVPSVEKEVFGNANATLYVPAQSLNDYQAHEQWGNFANVKAVESKVYLTIRQADQGCVRQAVNMGENYRLSIIPEKGWTINSVMYNDEDVTGQLVDNTYTTPAMTADGTLVVAFEQVVNGISTIETSRVRMKGDSNGNICINNITPGDVVTVYSANGMITHRQTANGSEMILNVDKHGVYLVTIGSSTFKLSI